jgi:PilZ domain
MAEDDPERQVEEPSETPPQSQESVRPARKRTTRRHERTPLNPAIACRLGSDDTAVVLHLSESGALIRLHRSVKPNQRYELTIRTDAGQIRAQVEVRHCRLIPGPTIVFHAGVEFMAIRRGTLTLAQVLAAARRAQSS